jgi:hypothetical protein
MNSGILRERRQSAIVCAAMFCAVLSSGVGLARADWDGSRRDSDYYWTIDSVVIARVVEIRKPSDPLVGDPDAIVARPLGALSGPFDAGKTPQIVIRGLVIPDGIRRGGIVLAAVYDLSPAFRLPNPDAIYCADQEANPPLQYMPGGQAVVGISGFSDSSVGEVLEVIQKLRHKPAVKTGDGVQYWRSHSVVVADAEKADPAGDGAVRYLFLVRGTLSGDYDAGRGPRLAVVLKRDVRPMVLDERVMGIEPRRDTMLLLLEKSESDGQWRIPVERAAFMPYTNDPIIQANAPRWAQHCNAVAEAIDGTLHEIQKRRGAAAVVPAPPKQAASRVVALADAAAPYWRTHSLIYADVGGTIRSDGQTPQYTFDLRPKLTLSGAFDAGKTPSVSASIALKDLGPNFNPSSIGSKAIVVLVRTGDSYAISPERPAFMPGDHAPICAVKDFDDPKVKETLEAVQKLRHAIDEAKPKGEPDKR